MLDVDQLDVAYGPAMALHGISITVEKGQMAFIIGRNGAGKTTLLKSIVGLLKPVRGSIVYDGSEVVGYAPETLALAGMRYVAQEKKVFSNLTVRENIEIAAYAAREPVDGAIDQLVEIYPKFSQFLSTNAGQLSGGQRQILLVARALIGTPKLLLIDEPTQGLAAIVIEEIGRILNNLKDQVSALIVEQNLAMVRRLADRIYILKEGKVVKTITDNHKDLDTRELEMYV
jgi:ABC-type branched-subunit amino acid transport system ATPase component